MNGELSPEFKAHVGNPGVRSSITKELQKILDSETTIEVNGKREKAIRAQLIAKVWYKKALGGEYPYMREMLDRTEGKVPDRIAGADGGAIQADIIAATIARIYPSEQKQVEAMEVVALEPPELPSPTEEVQDADA